MKILKNTGDKFYLIHDFVITGPVMAFTEMSPTYKDPICSANKSFHEKDRIYPAGAHDADNPNGGWILKP